MADNRFKPECAPGRSAGHRLAEPLCKNPSWATGGGATKSANRDPELNSPTMRRQVEEPPLVATYVKARRDHHIVSVAVIVAVGVNTDGGVRCSA
jgi:hypothetical protein